MYQCLLGLMYQCLLGLMYPCLLGLMYQCVLGLMYQCLLGLMLGLLQLYLVLSMLYMRIVRSSDPQPFPQKEAHTLDSMALINHCLEKCGNSNPALSDNMYIRFDVRHDTI